MYGNEMSPLKSYTCMLTKIQSNSVTVIILFYKKYNIIVMPHLIWKAHGIENKHSLRTRRRYICKKHVQFLRHLSVEILQCQFRVGSTCCDIYSNLIKGVIRFHFFAGQCLTQLNSWKHCTPDTRISYCPRHLSVIKKLCL